MSQFQTRARWSTSRTVRKSRSKVRWERKKKKTIPPLRYTRLYINVRFREMSRIEKTPPIYKSIPLVASIAWQEYTVSSTKFGALRDSEKQEAPQKQARDSLECRIIWWRVSVRPRSSASVCAPSSGIRCAAASDCGCWSPGSGCPKVWVSWGWSVTARRC